MSWLRAALLLSVLLALTCCFPALSYTAYVKKVSMIVPAVYLGSDGRLHGVVSNLSIAVVSPGEGFVYMSVEPLTQIDTQASARVAALVASMIAGVPATSYDYAIRLEAGSPVVGGPSASGAMAVAILAALRGVAIPSNVSMTGMICPDGTLGPVGGIPEKLGAAAKAGAKLFVVPRGQLVVRDPLTGRAVDVGVLGATLGVKVVEASTVVEAYETLTGDHLKIKQIPLKYPGWLSESMKRALLLFKEIATSNITCAKKLLNSLSPRAARMVNESLSEAERALSESEELLNEGKLYAAASRAFYAALQACYSCALARVFSASSPLRAATALTKSLANEAWDLVLRASREYEQALRGELTDVKFQLLVTAYDRLASANETLRSLPYASSVLDGLQAAVYAKLRAFTALLWSETALKAQGGRHVDPTTLSRSVYELLRYAETINAYLSALTGMSINVGTLTGAAKELEEGNLVAAASLTVESISRLAVELHRVFGTAKTLVDSAAFMAKLLGGRLASLGVQPLLPLAYAELGDQLKDPLQRLAAYESSASYSLLLYMLVQQPWKASTPTPETTIALTITKTETITKTTTVTLTTTEERTSTITETTTLSVETIPVHHIALAILCGIVIGFIVSRASHRRI